MRAYKFEVLVIDFEKIGKEEIVVHLEDTKYINPVILSSKEADIGEWHDDHPLNNEETCAEYCRKVFGEEQHEIPNTNDQ